MNINQEVAELRSYRGSAGNFLKKLLLLQIKLAGADVGAILKIAEGKAHILTTSIALETQPEWLTMAIQQAPQSLRRGEPMFLSLGGGQKHGVFLVPFPDTARGTVIVLTGETSLELEKMSNGTLTVAFSLLDNYEARMTLKQRKAAQDRIHSALDIEMVINRKGDYQSYCMELCNEMASRWNCSRVSLGLIRHGHTSLKYMSHTEKFSKKMNIVKDLEEAMEESADQDRELIYPPIQGARYIYRQLELFSKSHDKTAIITVPIHHAGHVEGVLMLERQADNPFTREDLETLRLTVDLTSPRLIDLEKYYSWTHRTIELCKSPFKFLVSRENTFAKLATTFLIVLIVFLCVAKDDYYIEGSFRMEVLEEKTLAAPYEGILAKVEVKPGDSVKAGQLLGEMDTLELQLKTQELEAEILNLNKEYTIAINDRNTAKSQIALARLKGVRAQKTMNLELIKRGKLIAPSDGVILSDDLTRLFRAPVKRGDELFIIGKVDELEALAYIPEDQIPDLSEDMSGEASLAGRPQDRISVHVSEIGAMAEVKEQQNVFKVRMSVATQPPWLRPGMEGLIKIKHSRKALMWIWSRKAINWVRMKLWL